ncbi:cyclic nucleotide-binding domain-containing protein [uncultured Erythrobacter sp.]|uniref:cyclic nucleotide-binding domain-containing protein n=1 Tax=uncultured Erythrobacter sp. TaxID=263913 RepID=UPI0026322A2E|nr:cyclic nucleotide-binding domain-containing protein [uncultured Erythrobacter sp.]
MSDLYKVAIIGSGPAGMSAAGQAATRGMSHILLEKTDHLSDTIFKYQKGKFVMATPSDLALRAGGYEEGVAEGMQFAEGTRETILGIWNKHCRIEDPNMPFYEGEVQDFEINTRLNAEVVSVEGEKGNFSIKLKDGDTIRAETIVLAIGTQGNPNKLRCPGADHPMITPQLDDPEDHIDKNIVVVGTGDAGIENALGLATDPALGNTVTILNRGTDFAKAKIKNATDLTSADEEGDLNIAYRTSPSEVRDGEMVVETATGEEVIPCEMIITRIGSQPPRKFIESMGIEFTSEDRSAFPKLSAEFETTKDGVFVIGALAGYPLIKHCMNQGFDVIEYLHTGSAVKPADEPLLEKVFENLPGGKSVDYWLELYRTNVDIFAGLSTLQMRELMLDSICTAFAPGEVIFRRDAPGSSLFALAQGSVAVEVNPNDPSITVPIGQGSIFGEVGLVSGRRRGATIRAAEDVVVVELSRKAALKLIGSSPEAAEAVKRISIERQILQLFGSGLTPEDIKPLVDSAETEEVSAGKVVIQEGDNDKDLFIVRFGSMQVEKGGEGRQTFLGLIPAGNFFGEMGVIDGQARMSTVKASVKSEVIRLPGEGFLELLAKKPQLRERAVQIMADRRRSNEEIESQQAKEDGKVDSYSGLASFLFDEGMGEATDALLIDERLCIGCDNCEKACADSHDGLSRLERETGKTFAYLHVPISCRHCEHPHCMTDCPPNAIQRGADGEVNINRETCIGCGNCKSNCPYGVINMEPVPPEKPSLLSWLMFGAGPGPGEAPYSWRKENAQPGVAKKAVKCDMCAGIDGGPSCVRACPTGAAIRVSPDKFLTFAKLTEDVES